MDYVDFLTRQIEQQKTWAEKNRDEALFIDTAHQNRSIVLTPEPSFCYTSCCGALRSLDPARLQIEATGKAGSTFGAMLL